MASVLSASVDTAAGVAPADMSAGTPSLQQRSAAVISDSGSTFGDAMVAYSSVVVSRDGLDGRGGGDGLRRRRGDNCAGDGNRSETPRLFESDMDAKPTDPDLDDHDGSDPILACRRRSRSMWLHFPHLELLFLFWAFEGAVAAQVSALKNAECAHVFWLALAALLLFPVLMLLMVWRTIAVRIRPNELLVFRVNDNNDQQGNNGLPQAEGALATDGGGPPTEMLQDDTQQLHQRGLWNKFAHGWLQKGMLFSWADTGQWESVATNDQDIKREADWFRIGFEPLFIDLSKLGCFYLVFLLVKWFGLACVGVLVEDSVQQLL
ncbi:unnamed protein product, partial [Ectocarpus sp. 12 AP-2014]